MNQREVKKRALKLCAHVLLEAINSGKLTDLIDDDTTDDEARRITEEADQIRFRLFQRAGNLQAAEVDVNPYQAYKRLKNGVR